MSQHPGNRTMKLSRICDRLLGQPMFNIMVKAQQLERSGHPIIHFEIGDQDAPSPECAIREAIRALKTDRTHYTDSCGIIELREAIADKIEATHHFKPNLDQILIAPANSIIDLMIRCVADPGDDIIIPDPGFPTYSAVTHYTGMNTIGVDFSNNRNHVFDPEILANSVRNNTRLIISNSPNNPTGSINSKQQLDRIFSIAEENNLFLLSDEVYYKLIYSGTHYSPGVNDECKTRSVILGSMSKIYSMSGWRIGYAVGPTTLIRKMSLLFQTMYSCMPEFSQIGSIAALKQEDNHIVDRLHELKKRRDTLVNGLNSVPGITCDSPDGSIYAFPDVRGTGMGSEEFCEKILNNGVCACPGDYFGKNGRGYVRFCFGSVSEQEIKLALEKILMTVKRK